MPRKPRPALPDLYIEGLSSGARVLMDDFTGQPIDQHQQPRALPKTGEEYAKLRNEHKRAMAQRVLIDAGMIKLEPKLVEVVPKGKRKIGEVNGQAILCDMPKWRRS